MPDRHYGYIMDDVVLRQLILDELGEETQLRSLTGFKLDFSANPGFRKIFFSASCKCGTASLLSVEISESKTDEEIENAIPSLVERLQRQERSFFNMKCDMHSMMQRGSYGNMKEE